MFVQILSVEFLADGSILLESASEERNWSGVDTDEVLSTRTVNAKT